MKRFSNILLIADTGTDQPAALQRAITLAKNNQAALTVCAVVDAIPAELNMAITAVTAAELYDIAVTDKRDQLEEIVKNVADDGLSIEIKVLAGKPFIEIIRQVLGNGYDLVIKSAEGAVGLKNMMFGSTDMHLMRKCPCPVWIVKSTEHQQYRRILAAVDQDPENAVKDALNRQILELSTSLALAEFSELHVVHAWRLFGESFFRSPRTTISDADVDTLAADEASERKRWLDNLVNTYSAKADKEAVDYVSPQLHMIKGDARNIVPSTATELDVDLIVMGTVARTGIDGFFMGNTAESILTQLDCSVLTIKPPGFISPVKTES